MTKGDCGKISSLAQQDDLFLKRLCEFEESLEEFNCQASDHGQEKIFQKKILKIERDFKKHLRQEEDLLFPRLLEKKPIVSPEIKLLKKEHAVLLKLYAKVIKNIFQYSKLKSEKSKKMKCERVKGLLVELIFLTKQHCRKELSLMTLCEKK